MLTQDEQMEAYQQFLDQQAAAAAKASRGNGGGGYIPFLKLEDKERARVRFLTGQLLSPRYTVHELRKGKELVWSGKCTANWVGAPPCAGCLKAAELKETGDKDHKMNTSVKTVPLVYDYRAVGQTRTGTDGKEYPADTLKKFPRSASKTPAFYEADKEYQVTGRDMIVARSGEGKDTEYSFAPAMVKQTLDINGELQEVDVAAKTPFVYEGEDKKVLAVLEMVAKKDLPGLFDFVLQSEDWCPGQLDANGQPMDEKAPNLPKENLAILIAGNMIPDPRKGAQKAEPDAKLAPASRPRVEVGDEE